MSPQPMSERREHPRLAVQGGVFFYHPGSGREWPARTVDLSRSGLWMNVPPQVPLRAGQEIQVLVLPEVKDERSGDLLASASRAHPLPATILRVDRASLPSTGQVGVAVRFDTGPG